MKYYSTNRQTPEVSLRDAVVKGLAADNGLFMPEIIHKFSPAFFETIQNLTFQEMRSDNSSGSELKINETLKLLKFFKW